MSLSDHFLCLCKRHYHLFTDLGNAEGSIPPSLCPEHHNWLSNCLQAQGSGVPQVLTITVLRLLVASLVLQASQKMLGLLLDSSHLITQCPANLWLLPFQRTMGLHHLLFTPTLHHIASFLRYLPTCHDCCLLVSPPALSIFPWHMTAQLTSGIT